MLDVKSFLEKTGMKVSENYFSNPPALPYIIFSDTMSVKGADSRNCLLDRSITVELYSKKIIEEKEKIIENLLNEKSIKFVKNRTWIDSENFFQTVYDFNLYEKLD